MVLQEVREWGVYMRLKGPGLVLVHEHGSFHGILSSTPFTWEEGTVTILALHLQEPFRTLLLFDQLAEVAYALHSHIVQV